MSKKTEQTIHAGLAIHDDFIRFIELDEHGTITRKASVPLPEGCILNGSIRNFSMLEEAFKTLHDQTGKIRHPVTIGLPYGDTVIRRPIVFPKMSIEDVRSAIDLNFEEYFTSRTDTIFDAVIIRTPAEQYDKDKVSVLAATTKQSLAEKILDIARKAEIPVGAIEPVNFSMLRAVPQAREGMCIFADSHNIIATWEGYGIFFRIANELRNYQDILNTIQFLGTQYRHVQVSKIILAGVDPQIVTDTGMTVTSIDDPYYSAKGLALRGSNLDGLDLRPAEYVELERRRSSFNPNRLALWGLLIGFIAISAATMCYAFMAVQNIQEKIYTMQGNVSGLSTTRKDIAQDNSQLDVQKKKIENVLNFIRSDIPVLEILNAIEENMTEGVKYDNADFTPGSSGRANVNINGKAGNDGEILAMTEGLKASGLFESVMLPVTQRDNQQRKVFRLVLTTKDILSRGNEEAGNGK